MKPKQFLTFALIFAGAFLAIEPSANAADIYRRAHVTERAPVAYEPPPLWAGFYIGANLGGAWDDTDDVELVDDATLIGGIHLGYNWQSYSEFVLGIEADVDFLQDVDYLSSVRGRFGYAFGAALAYATGGVAFIGFDDASIFSDDTTVGWAAGLGFDYKVRDDLSFGLEGLYYSFDAEDDALFDDDANFWTARARLTYHFGRDLKLQ